ncbi:MULTISPECIES: hypothetical protein [unclassified Amycolatopsis]|uniref:hypothetical protein n=1 Tax=unclassified Amycolatopsis TaxID=2618356 RepID=UPI002875A451|nr:MULTISPECIES: hypothetical protein [unclassified Amycolatopsis]MDS0137279.1 hypothetical protein [Amycolatopsis sp. 505]MDS0141474.1 hypothetical protein [Amycolatopsis sp. CM201R]
MRDNAKRADGVRSPREREIVMQVPTWAGDAGIESKLLDLGEVPLSRLRTLDGTELQSSLRYAAERVSYIPVTASGSGGARRVD